MADAGASQRRGLHSTLTRTGQGQTITPLSSSGESYAGRGFEEVYPTGGGGGPIFNFRMRGWRPGTSDFEFWESTGSPNTSNPSGLPIQDITVVAEWTS